VVYFPIFLDLSGRPCVVIGGGPVAERKVEGLLAAEAVVTVVSPTVTPGLQNLADTRQVQHLARCYQIGDLVGFALAFASTDDGKVNAAVYREAQELGIWVNAADDPAYCTFLLAGVVRRGDLVVAVGTGGKSPALTRVVREELDAFFGQDYIILSEVAARARRTLRARGRRATGQQWCDALKDIDFRRLVQVGQQEEAITWLLQRLGEPQ
jgi:siroheme synthase-like protein